jgi:hypothetical protein
VLKLAAIVVFLYSSISFADFIPQNLKTLDLDHLEFTLSKQNLAKKPPVAKENPSEFEIKSGVKTIVKIQYVPVYIPIKIPAYQPIYIPKYIPINY